MIDFNDELISMHMDSLRSEGFPAKESARVFSLLVKYASGTASERAIADIVENLDEDHLSPLLLEYVYPEYKLIPGAAEQSWRYQAPHIVVESLLKQGIGVRESTADGWTLTLPDGEAMSVQFRGSGEIDVADKLPGRDVALARLALRAIAISRMRAGATSKSPPLEY